MDKRKKGSRKKLTTIRTDVPLRRWRVEVEAACDDDSRIIKRTYIVEAWSGEAARCFALGRLVGDSQEAALIYFGGDGGYSHSDVEEVLTGMELPR